MSTPTNVRSDVTQEEAAELLSDLVSFDSQNPPGREAAVAKFVAGRLDEWGIDAQLVPRPYEDRPQVVAEVGDGDPEAGTLVLNGHLDVVPPGDAEQWTHDPFGGTIEGDRVYGRGASDMKGGVAAGMLALRAAHEAGVDGRVILTCAIGEETAEPGTKTLLEEIDGDWGIVLEPTELMVDTVGKGLAWYEIEVRGTSSHASQPHLGANVLDALFAFSEHLQSYRERISEREHPLVGTSLCSPTMLEAGTKENVIPDSATLTLDRRFLPDEDVADIDDEIDALCDPLRADGFDVSVERTRTYEAAEIDVDDEIAEVVREHSADVAGVDTAPHGKVASTDQRNFVNDANIPAIIWGPGTSPQSHTVDEWARTDLLVDGVEILCRTIDDLCTN
ncbi:M20 family metallopeptidase [Salinirarus marinus]|uniref:M20 family metallopeptidase n=1 Tax=Salinirarus marinus TaxID=3068310 RepID=UPI003C6C7734